MNKPEIVAPAGNPEKLEYAIAYGADAVYLGGASFGLRTAAASFDRKAIAQAVEFAHRRGVKVYVTVNIFARNRDIEILPGYIAFLSQVGVDAVIVSDPGVLALVRETAPGLRVHISTQANTTNWRSAQTWRLLGAARIVAARELSLAEIADISKRSGTELEVFVHGAMCMAYSGRCLLSNYMTGRDANRGDCAQSCRWQYHLVEEKRPGEFLPVYEDEQGAYIMSSRDLCLLEHLPGLVEAGVTAFKIEGRVKSIHYVATITGVYRRALDAYLVAPGSYKVQPEWLEEIGKVSNRDYTSAFISGASSGATAALDSIYRRDYTFVGAVLGYDHERKLLRVEQRNHFAVGQTLEIIAPQLEQYYLPVQTILDEKGQPMETAPHPRQIVYLPWPGPLPPYSLLRRAES